MRSEQSPIRSTGSRVTAIAAAMALASLASSGHAQQPTSEEMWRTIQRQQQEIQDLKRRIEGTDKKVEATATAVEKAGAGGGADGWWRRTTLGGYGELHYNGGDADQLDFHRFVLFVGHRFNDRLRLFSELEVEHALVEGGEDSGEVELEQAWLEYDVTERMSARAGLFLLPVGILNETHEPPTFYGVERNRVETNIIPSTWWEGGAGVAYKFDNGVRLDAQVHGGLDMPTTGEDAFVVRDGRQKVAQSTLRDPAFTGRVRYTGISGVELASTVQYQADVTQGDPGDPETDAVLWEAHADVKRAISDRATLGFRALYARWDMSGTSVEAVGRDEQYGWYLEPSIRFATTHGDVGFFARYSQDDNTAGDDTDSLFEEITFGVNYWIHPDAVLKADYQIQQPPEGTARDNRVNLGVGFQF